MRFLLKDLHDGRVVKIFQHTKWPNQTVPESPDGVITLMSLVEKARQTSGKGPVTVMCR